ncbi:Glycosyltransferase [Neisseria gonorrhoeae]|uniref:Glycosyltransferase n=1 Tax=Neisseria gonorrhoeae TaxID=485 RepID=A0AB74EQV1_NEIGO|nr:Glycosyltransferase [Neisseria gonorrhoeae]
MQPLVSVLICAYNVEKYFAQSLSAVVGQTWRNLDILIVDDGSTDGTPAIARRFQEQDGRIRIISNPRNLGFIASLNIGLDELAKSGGGNILRAPMPTILPPPAGLRKSWARWKKTAASLRWARGWKFCRKKTIKACLPPLPETAQFGTNRPGMKTLSPFSLSATPYTTTR